MRAMAGQCGSALFRSGSEKCTSEDEPFLCMLWAAIPSSYDTKAMLASKLALLNKFDGVPPLDGGLDACTFSNP